VIYRKRGAVVRWENGVIVRVAESGMAREAGELFECRPEPPARSVSFDEAEERVRAAAAEVGALAPPGIAIERLLVMEGTAEHEVEERAWAETTRRVHLSLVRGRTRALLDLASFELDDVARVARALERLDDQDRPAPAELRLAPNVSAALLPALAANPLPDVRVIQTGGGIDGRGEPIIEAEGQWPNWYRPSYRVRPIRTAMNVRIEVPSAAIDSGAPLAVALAGPLDALHLRVLVDDGRVSYPAVVRVSRIRAAGPVRRWYPYGAGSFGVEMML
jgi:hypothetical protein